MSNIQSSLGDYFMKVKTKLAFVYYKQKDLPRMCCYLRLKTLWSENIEALIDSELYNYVDVCIKEREDVEEMYVYFRVNDTERCMNSMKLPTTKIIRGIIGHLSIDPLCHYAVGESFSIGTIDPIVKLFDVTIDLDILRDNTESSINFNFELKRLLEEILWKKLYLEGS